MAIVDMRVRDSSEYGIALGDMVYLYTSLNQKTGSIWLKPVFYGSRLNDYYYDEDLLDHGYCEVRGLSTLEYSIRVFRPVNPEKFTPEKEDEKWLGRVNDIKADPKKVTKDGRSYVYYYVEIEKRIEKVLHHYDSIEGVFVERVVSGTAEISRKEIQLPTVTKKLYRGEQDSVFSVEEVSHEGKVLLLNIVRRESPEAYQKRRLQEIEDNPFATQFAKKLASKGRTTEAIIEGAISGLPSLPRDVPMEFRCNSY